MYTGVIHQNSIASHRLEELYNSRDEALETYLNKLIGELRQARFEFEDGKITRHQALCNVEPVCSLVTGSNAEDDLEFFLTAPFDDVRKRIDCEELDESDYYLEFKAEEFNLGADEYQFLYEKDGLVIQFRNDTGYIKVFQSPVTVRVCPCSPCYPDQGCLDGGDGRMETYALPLDWFDADAPCPYAHQLRRKR